MVINIVISANPNSIIRIPLIVFKNPAEVLVEKSLKKVMIKRIAKARQDRFTANSIGFNLSVLITLKVLIRIIKAKMILETIQNQ